MSLEPNVEKGLAAEDQGVTEPMRPQRALHVQYPCHRDQRILRMNDCFIVDGARDVYRGVKHFVNSFFSTFDRRTALNQIMAGRRRSRHQRYSGKTRQQIQNMWRASGQKQTIVSDALHLAIQTYYDVTTSPPPHIVPLEYYLFRAFQKYAHARRWKPYRNNWNIFDEDLQFAAQVDMVYSMPGGRGHMVLVEWKRVRVVNYQGYNGATAKAPLDSVPDSAFARYAITMNVYKHILEKKYRLNIQKMLLVNMYMGTPLHRDFHIHHIPVTPWATTLIEHRQRTLMS